MSYNITRSLCINQGFTRKMDTFRIHHIRNPELLVRGLDPHSRKDKDSISRLRRYLIWTDYNERSWLLPNLGRYRDYLLKEAGISEVSAKIHLSTIRARYKTLLEQNGFADEIRMLLAQTLEKDELDSAVHIVLKAILAATDPAQSAIISEPKPSEHVRLTVKQAQALICQPGLKDLVGQRDTALISLLLATGVRVSEACALSTEDIRHTTESGLALRVEPTHERKERRYVPYGEMIWVLSLIDYWLRKAQINEGPVFRAFHKTSKAVRKAPLSVSAVEFILSNYPLEIDGKEVTVTPMVLRRTYASRLYEEGVPFTSIEQFLGVGRAAVLDYIGDTTRKPVTQKIPNLYTIDQSSVEQAIRTGRILIETTESRTQQIENTIGQDPAGNQQTSE